MGDISLGRSIRKRRDSLGISQARLAELVGRSATTIRNWERDKTSPSARSDVVALAAVLGLDESETLTQAGFESEAKATHVTMEESYSSLGPTPPVTTPPAVPKLPEDSGPPEETRLPEDAEPLEDAEPPEETEPPGAAMPPEDAMPPKDSELPADSAHPAESGPAADTQHSPDARPEDTDPGNDPEAEETAAEAPAGDTFSKFFRSETAGRSPDAAELETLTDTTPERGRRLRRAAPPTVLESAPVGEPSYLEVPEERQRYRMRALVTAIAVVALVFVLLWSFDRATDAFAGMWNEFISVLDF